MTSVSHVCDLEDVNRKVVMRNRRGQSGGRDESDCPHSGRWGKTLKVEMSKNEGRMKSLGIRTAPSHPYSAPPEACRQSSQPRGPAPPLRALTVCPAWFSNRSP